MSAKPNVIIVGGGFAGLVAANELKQKGIPFTILEGGKSIGGLAQTFTDQNGFKFDFGTHLITNRLAKAIGVEDQCLPVSYFGESVWLRGRTYSYPFGLLLNPAFPMSTVVTKAKNLFRNQEQNFASKARADFGNKLASEVAIPLAESLMGAPATELATSVSNKLPGILRTLYLRAAGQLTRKAVAIGYCMELPESRKVWHMYPTHGIKTLCDKLAAGIEEHIRLETAVDKIFVENEKVKGVRANGTFMPADIVINTAPVNVLPNLIEGSTKLDHLKRFKYRAMIFVNVMMQGTKVLPNVALWTPEKHFPFFRLNEPSYAMPWLAPEGKTMITADVGCAFDDEHWRRTDTKWEDYILPFLEEIIPDIRERFLGCHVLKTKYAYPTYLTQYEDERVAFLTNTGIEGLHSIGRNGEFMHILMEDVYIRTKKKINAALKRNGQE